MSKEGFRDRIYHIEQETDGECEKRKADEAEVERVDRLRSTYRCRAYGTFIPKLRPEDEASTEAKN